MSIGFAVLMGIATGYLWGDHWATQKANKRLDLWRNEVATLQTDCGKKDAKIAVLYAMIEAMRHGQMMVTGVAARKEAESED